MNKCIAMVLLSYFYDRFILSSLIEQGAAGGGVRQTLSMYFIAIGNKLGVFEDEMFVKVSLYETKINLCEPLTHGVSFLTWSHPKCRTIGLYLRR
ncbi:hypothetical protein RSAG8_09574, partial [Rhizoctonia solani AG-8 WAC10335]